jgi:hypothetical protein
MLDVYIAHCDAVVHLVGEMTGSEPAERVQRALLAELSRSGRQTATAWSRCPTRHGDRGALAFSREIGSSIRDVEDVPAK